MELPIEPEDATSSSRRAPGGAVRVRGGVVSLDLTVPAQDRPHWCWAAIAVALERYHGRPARDQAAIARGVLGDEIDLELGLDRALITAACYSHWSPGKPTLARVQFEINLGRPVGVRIGWHGGGGHYVLVTGYAAATGELLVADPQRGDTRVAFTAFPRGYAGGGTWTESFWTTHPSPRVSP